MKVPLHVVHARRERLAQLLEQHRYLPVKELCRRLGVSEATTRRDLAALVQEKKITRTFGGALSEFNDRFPSFRHRQAQHSKGKGRIASVALSMLEPEKTYFFDSGTTIFALAEAFRDKPVTPITIVTSNLPVGETLAAIPGVQVFQVAGQLLHLQSTLLGETAQRSLEFWDFDGAFLSAEAMNASGLWNSQVAIVVQQKAVLRRSRQNVFCIDTSKLDRLAAHFLLGWRDVEKLVTDVPFETLRAAGIPITDSQYIGTQAQTGKARSRARDSASGEPEDDLPVHVL